MQQFLAIIGSIVVVGLIVAGSERVIDFIISRGMSPASTGGGEKHGAGKTVSGGRGGESGAETQ